ncbi:hypothetical protein WJX72_003449 [[Myrmecia] bisecta]|uniref:Uncharacterized protein n=1 Tax=[Myrmecia] bisecta TaxID=41462 RepID=A0AAW1PL15_9CHLO
MAEASSELLALVGTPSSSGGPLQAAHLGNDDQRRPIQHSQQDGPGKKAAPGPDQAQGILPLLGNLALGSRPAPRTAAELRADREALNSKVASRMNQREKELADLPNRLPNDLRLKALIERKRLQLAGLQKKLRSDVATENSRARESRADVLLEWSQWRRQQPGVPHFEMPAYKPPPPRVMPTQATLAEAQAEANRQRLAKLREAEVEKSRREQQDKLRALQRKLEEERRRKQDEAERIRRVQEEKQRVIQERRNFLAELMAHARENLRPNAQAALKRRVQRNAGIRAWHARESKKVSREAAARIMALKDNNYEEYLRLAHNAKDKRLRTLLDKTDNIIAELGLKVEAQRAGTLPSDEEPLIDIWMDGAALEELAADETGLDERERELVHSQRNYYNQVHVVKEQVVQPEMLQGGTLRHYQLGGLKFMLSLYNNRMNGILADEMGLGKTIQTIGLLAFLMEKKGNNGPHMILAPKAVLSNWQSEFAKWVPNMNIVAYDGSPEERKVMRVDQVEQGTFNVLLTHYDLVMRDKAALRKIQWELLIVDEGHRLKNAESKLADVLRSYSFKYRILLTGTPIQNSLAELWALLNFVLPSVFNSSDTFDEWFAAPFRGQSEDVSNQLNEEEQLLVITRLHQVLRPFMLRRTKAEVEKELPGKREHVIRCSMSAWQKILYQQITEQGKVRMDAKASRSLQNTAMHLRKACNHPYLFLQDHTFEPQDPEDLVRAAGKLDLLDNILPKLQASGHRVLLFSQMTRVLDIIQDFLALRGFSYLRLDGSTKTDDRGRMLREFNAEGSPVFIFMLSTRAGGLGLNLQTADTVIMFDSDWNPQMDLQAEDRAHRIGQKREVLVLVLVSAGTVEQVILDRAQQKRDIDAKVIQAGMFNDKSTHGERQQALQAVLRKGANDIGADVHTEREVNELVARTEEEYRKFQQMDRERWARAGRRSQLMRLEDVPAWVLQQDQNGKEAQSDAEVLEEAEGENGVRQRRRRSRQAVVIYKEGMSDAMFQRLIEVSEDEEPANTQSKAPPKRKRRRSSPDVEATGASEVTEADERPPPAKQARRATANGTAKPPRRGRLRKAGSVSGSGRASSPATAPSASVSAAHSSLPCSSHPAPPEEGADEDGVESGSEAAGQDPDSPPPTRRMTRHSKQKQTASRSGKDLKRQRKTSDAPGTQVSSAKPAAGKRRR